MIARPHTRRRGSGRRGLTSVPAFVPVLGVILALLATAGCGYRAGELYHPDVDTVAIAIFDNDTYVRGVEFAMHESLIKHVELHTPYKVTTEQRAASLLTGRIRSATQRGVSRDDDTGLVEEVEAELSIDVRWVDRRSGDVLLEQRNLRVAEPYIPARGGGERVFAAERAILDQLARRIVDGMQQPW